MNPDYLQKADQITAYLDAEGPTEVRTAFADLRQHIDRLTQYALLVCNDYRESAEQLDFDDEKEEVQALADGLEDHLNSSPDGMFRRLLRYRETWPTFNEFTPDNSGILAAADWERRLNWTLIEVGSDPQAVLVTADGRRLTQAEFAQWQSELAAA